MAGIEESWDLFLQQIHLARLPSEVEAIWRHIVNYFKGLPFAIVIAAGLARAINESLWISKETERILYERMCLDLVEDASAFPVQLRMLTLKGTLVPWDAMEEVIGMLPNLQVLKLKYQACIGKDWKLNGGGFPKLKSLLIHGMELAQWTATENAFPILEHLIVIYCSGLKKIPSTFGDLYSLQLIEFYNCHSLLVHSAKQIQQQQQESYGDNWFAVHDYNTFQSVSIEEKEQVKRGNFEEQEREKVKYKASDPESSNVARQVFEEVDSKPITNIEFFNCFEDDFDNNDIN
ncbi:PREDICTED: putative late blight resistance protein homolog R1A-4 [Ipomoea nil]|uniref:putative late blight resistance protein homolog R1A-4 n=1 Tax=Ipomoea nil TaxID=35883 RepID=UPI0009015A63|nr:PREDICTED: putative late blight resistance protein homolog R1A-4 [Ipomoea nil]